MRSRKSNRKQNFNYASEGIYFITSCCKGRVHHFGEVINDVMDLNEFGLIAQNQILWLEKQYPYISLHNSVVMPNHVHILFEIVVGTGRDLSSNTVKRTGCDLSSNTVKRTGCDLSSNTVKRTGRDLSLPKIKSVSSLIGAFKTTTSKSIHLAGNYSFSWQRSFHDRIVNDSRKYDLINKYITENPKLWSQDIFNKFTNPNYKEN
jgi:REP element-mobilizing transposase RayT